VVRRESAGKISFAAKTVTLKGWVLASRHVLKPVMPSSSRHPLVVDLGNIKNKK